MPAPAPLKALAALACASLFAVAAEARPMFIEESARISNPNPAAYEHFGNEVALDGDEALISLAHYVPNPEYYDEYHTSVWLFRRVNGAWTPVREIATDLDVEYLWDNGMAMRDGVAALALNPVRIFEKVDGEWVAASAEPIDAGPGDSITIENGRILYGGSDGTFKGTLIEKSPADGVWRVTTTMYGEYRSGDDEQFGRDVDISGNYAVVISPYSDDRPNSTVLPNVYIFLDFGGPTGWAANALIESSPEAPLGPALQIRGEEVFVGGSEKTGTHVFRRQPSGRWPLADRLQPVNGYLGGQYTYLLRKSDRYIMQQAYDHDRGTYVINAFTKNPAGNYAHVATLVSSRGEPLWDFAISGRTVLADCGDHACFFELPETFADPAPVHDTFSGSSPTGWALSAGSQFAIAQSGVSRVLRQSETASPATHAAVLTAANGANQSVQADVQPTAFAGNDRWVGLATRYSDAGHHYYVTLRSSGTVSLRKQVGGSFTTLASTSLPVTLDRNYRLRLESIGTRHRVFVDGAPLLEATDASLASGRPALLTYRSAADFDNVFVTGAPAATLWAVREAERPFDSHWTTSGPGLWANDARIGVERIYAQYSVAGDARAVTGESVGDQSVEVRARATTFAGTGGGERWFGAIARYRDDSNYYYLSLRSGGSVSLRKLTSGSITVLGTATLPVTVGRWYQLRLEAVGTRLRAYIDGALVLEATDSTHRQGRTGLVTYRAAAQYAGYRATRP